MPRLTSIAFAAGLACAMSSGSCPAQQPVNTPFQSGYGLPVGFAYHGTDLMYVYERRGVVRVVDHGVRLTPPLIDLRDEVGGWRDFGMLGFALDPDFANNGYYYLSYVVDRHHLLHHGTPSYNAATDEYYAATIARVTRYTADVTTGFTTTVPGSRLVLFGESASTGAPILYESHGSGQLVFGRDGTLLVAFGDGASYLTPPDVGSSPESYYQQALADGILRPEENVGAFRAQMVTSFSGKILRLDPATGDGLPSNPFYDAGAPRSARSRVWALGFRNPFRMCVRPGTGSTNPSLGQPGTIYLGDVGWFSREELNVVHHGGHNFGWPLYEGIDASPQFTPLLVANGDAPNPLVGTGGCTQTHFHFQDLLQQAQDSHISFFPNPCDAMVGIAAVTPTFRHTPPVLDWHHSIDDARVPVFENGRLVARQLGTPAAGVPGPQFHGGCSVGGCWHSGISFPVGFGPCYYLADFEEAWIRRFEFDDDDELVAVHDLTDAIHVIMMGECPVDHSLIYIGLQDQLHKLAFGVEPPPVAVPTADVRYGVGSFDVQLDARASFDPEGQPLTYFWDLGHGRTSTSPQLGYPLHGNGSATLRQIQLTVTDPNGAYDTATLPIAIDNTPPVVAITSFANGDTYPLTAPTVLPLAADVVDAEHGPTQLNYSWRLALHHESHTHPEPPDLRPTTSAVISPTPTGSEFFAYSVELTVTDAGGLSTTVEHWLFPDTSAASTSVLLTSPRNGDRIPAGSPVELQALTTGSVQRVEYYVDGELVGIANTPPYAASWLPTSSGPLTALALAVGTDATSSNTRGIPFTVEAPVVTMARGSGPAVDAIESRNPPGAPITNGTALVLGDDGTPWLAGLHFQLPAIPVGARVQSASIDFVATQSDAGPARLQICCDASPSARPIGMQVGDLGRRKTGANVVSWSPADWVAGASGPAQRTPDLSALLQPAIDQMKWNGSLLFLIRGAGVRRAVTWNGNPLTGPVLSVAWLPPLPPQQNLPVTADGDEDAATGTVDLAGSMLRLGEHQGVSRSTALQFALTLPRDTRIESARIRFTSAGSDTGPATLTIRAQDADDATPLMPTPYDISGRPQIQDSITWYPPEWPTAGASGNDQLSPDIAGLVEQLLARPGWQPGGKIVLVLEGTGSRTAASFDAGQGDAPKLELEYHQP
jgi:glucose/arabinose dehydrogenase/PKD repeat protein